MKTRILSVLVVFSFLFVNTISAQPGEQAEARQKLSPEKKPMVMKKRQAMRKSDRKPFFTDEQKETMKTLRLETAKQVKPLKNELNELMARQHTLSTADNADLKAINKNIDKMSVIKTEIAKIHAVQHQEIRNILTKEQLLKFDSMKQKRPGRGSNFRSDTRMERQSPKRRGV